MTDASRRLFLVAGSAALLSAQSPNDVVRVAFIGVGNRGSFLLKHMLTVPGVQVVAVSDLDPERLQAAQAAVAAAGGKADAYPEFRKLLDRKDIDAVVIATPVSLHKEMVLAALEVGKHVYSEKPMGLDSAHCGAVLKAAQSAKGIYQAGFQLRHDPNRNASVKWIQSGGIGKVVFLQGYRHSADLPHNTPWLFDRAISGDSIVEQACHIIDLMVWVAGAAPLRAFGSGGINLFKDDPPGRTVMDNYAVIYEFPGDLRFTFSHIFFDPPQFSGVKERVFGADGAIDLATATTISRAGKTEKIEVPNAGKDSTYMSVAAFITNARAKQKPLNDAESARRSTLAAVMGRKSIYEKRVVEWKEVDV